MIREQLQADLKAAMVARHRVAVDVLRSTLAAIANAEAVAPSDHQPQVGLYGDVARRELGEADIVAIVAAEQADLEAAAADLEALGRPSEADRLRTQATLLAGYLCSDTGT